MTKNRKTNMKTKQIKDFAPKTDNDYKETTYQEKWDLLHQIHDEIEKKKNEPFLLMPTGTVANLAQLSD